MNSHRYILEPYRGQRTRHTCPNPQCGKPHEFTRYIDTEAGGAYVAPHVGKCNRLDNCGYHYPPAKYFADNPQQPESWKDSNAWQTTYTPTVTATQPKPIDFLPWGLLEASQKQYEANNFIRYLVQLFGQEKALELVKEYNLGTSKKWQNDGGLSVVFWQVDISGQVRQAKVMAYNPTTGRRLKAAEGEKEKFVAFMGKLILKKKDANLQQCLFGEHLLARYPEAPVCLVESEKTALIMAGFLPAFVWLATGGKNGAKWTDREVYKALEGRKVVLYPDLGAFDAWKEKSKLLATVCDVSVSNLLEGKAQGSDWEQGYDIADFFVKAHQQPQESTEAPRAEVEAVHFTENAQEAPQEAPATEGSYYNSTLFNTIKKEDRQGQSLPEGFKVVHINGGHVLEVNGLPVDWLTDEEQNQAWAMLEGYELAYFTAVNPLVGELVERFELENSNS